MKITYNDIIGVVVSVGQSVGKDRIFLLKRNQVMYQSPFLYVLAHGFHSFMEPFWWRKGNSVHQVTYSNSLFMVTSKYPKNMFLLN